MASPTLKRKEGGVDGGEEVRGREEKREREEGERRGREKRE